MRILLKRLTLSLLAVIILLGMLEFGVRILFFQLKGNHVLAIQDAVVYLRARRANTVRTQKMAEVGRFKEQIRGCNTLLYADLGRTLLAQFSQEYETNFAGLVKEARNVGTHLMVLYLPSRIGPDPSVAERYFRTFSAGLARKYGVDYLDLTDVLLRYPLEQVTLLPANSHLSRFGNQLISEELTRTLDRHYRSPGKYEGHPRVCGDLAPNSAEVWTENLKMPYLVKVNQQGFRMVEDIAIPKIKQRVLCLGDSFTFSPYLPNHDTYPALLSARVPEMEVINAGVGGYTITDEAGLFIEKAKYVAPDITVLQVLDNDITDLFWFHRNEFDRSHKTFRPSKNEQEFIDIVIKRNAATNAPSAP